MFSSDIKDSIKAITIAASKLADSKDTLIQGRALSLLEDALDLLKKELGQK